MKHLMVKAATTTAEKGVFSALAATYSVDRTGERIIPGAFAKTIAAWQASSKMLPLHWDHRSSADSIIGYVDPASMAETDEGLYVEGKLDIKTSDVAREAWRSMKNNAVSLSFGYLPKLRKGKDGVTEITEVDLFEVSIVPAPANADTRLLSLKAVEKAVWSTAYVNDLPDSAFLYVEDGERDEEGKTTPRTKRHFPYKDAEGTIDLPHLRNALARIPQSNLPQDLKDRLTAKAERILENASKALHRVSAVEDGGDEEPKAKSAPQDPLVKEAWELVLPKPTGARLPAPEPEPDPEPLDAAQVQREAWALALKSSG